MTPNSSGSTYLSRIYPTLNCSKTNPKNFSYFACCVPFFLGVKKQKREKLAFHKEFPKLAKRLGFRVYKQGFPDFLIEKEGRQLIEAGFEYVCTYNYIMLFRKRK